MVVCNRPRIWEVDQGVCRAWEYILFANCLADLGGAKPKFFTKIVCLAAAMMCSQDERACGSRLLSFLTRLLQPLSSVYLHSVLTSRLALEPVPLLQEFNHLRCQVPLHTFHSIIYSD
jgi:hypothetical protein